MYGTHGTSPAQQLEPATLPASATESNAATVSPERAPRGEFSCNGVRIDVASYDRAADEIVQLSLRSTGSCAHLVNAYTVALAQTDAPYRNLLNESALNLPDGTPVAWVGRAAGHRGLTPTRGVDVTLATLAAGVPYGIKHYFYGSDDATTSRMVTELRKRVPGADIVGWEAPPFRPLSELEEHDFRRRVQRSGANIIWVGLGTPRQDQFVQRFSQVVAAMFVPIGAAFDFLAGTKPEAPVALQRVGLEWVFRLATEPRRLWRRYLWGNSVFLLTLVRSRRTAPQATAS